MSYTLCRPMRFASAFTASLLLACGSAGAPVTSQEDTASNAVQVPLADIPFPAERIRDATPAGRTYVFRFEQGGSQSFARWVFERVDSEGFTFVSTSVDERAEPIGESERSEGTWAELETHAHFSSDETTIEEAELTLPLGTFRCRLYTVRDITDDGRPEVSRYWFADALPGAPIRMEHEIAGEIVRTMTLVSHEPPIPEG